MHAIVMQGEENVIIILSLVRSNRGEKIGYLSAHNRVCVALSRAQHGLYVIGNLNMIRTKNELWEQVCRSAESRGQLGPAIPLAACPTHGIATMAATTASDFDQAPHGGCAHVCGFVRHATCGHRCVLVCHPGVTHDDIPCPEPCKRPRPAECIHTCDRTCGEECGPCIKLVTKLREMCGHKSKMACSMVPDEYRCTAVCGATLPCGHFCPAPCMQVGHLPVTGHVCADQCERTRATCDHPCPKLCREPCGACEVLVDVVPECGHAAVQAVCGTAPRDVQCNAPCRATLPCGHACTAKCSQRCASKPCRVLVPVASASCPRRPPHDTAVPCCSVAAATATTVCDLVCDAPLACGHGCPRACHECTPAGSTAPPSHGKCAQSCTSVMLCGHRCAAGAHPCGTPCPPCREPCSMACAHGVRCSRPCGVPCEVACGAATFCAHGVVLGNCAKREAAVPAAAAVSVGDDGCLQRCSEPLRCGHACMGTCGAACPAACAVCDTTLQPEARFLALRCGHDVRLPDFLERLSAATARARAALSAPAHEVIMWSSVGGALVPLCPTCGGPAVPQDGSSLGRAYAFCAGAIAGVAARNEALRVRSEVAAGIAAAAYKPTAVRLNALIRGRAKEDPMLPLLCSLLGDVYVAAGNMAGAVNEYTRASRLSGALPELRAQCALGAARAVLGGADASAGPVALQSVQPQSLEIAAVYLKRGLDVLSGAGDEALAVRSSLQSLQRAVAGAQAAQAAAASALETDAAARAAAVAAAEAAPDPDAAAAVAARRAARSSDVARRAADTARALVAAGGGNALHLAAASGRVEEIAGLLEEGADPSEGNASGATPLHVAVTAGHTRVADALLRSSSWMARDAEGRTFLDVALAAGGGGGDAAATWGRDLARATLAGTGPPDAEWTALRAVDGAECEALDDLFGLVGIGAVKTEALLLHKMLTEDLKRPAEARVASVQALNFQFLGNPGAHRV